MRISTGHFGVFVITAAIYAAGNLGLPDISLSIFLPESILPVSSNLTSDDVSRLLTLTPGVIPSPFVAIFGLPAMIGLTLGHLVASTTSPLGPIALYSPISTFVGLASIKYLRRYSVILGSLIYTVITAVWISFTEMVASGLEIFSTLPLTFIGQLVPIIMGYAVYLVAKSANIFKGGEEEKSEVKTTASPPIVAK